MELETDALAMLPKPYFRELIDKKAKWQVDQFLFGRENGERPTLQIKRFIEGIISFQSSWASTILSFCRTTSRT